MRSLDDVVKEIKGGLTHYERQNGIKRERVELLRCGDDFGLLTVLSSDHTLGLVIAFQAGERWFYFFPSENQMNYLNRLGVWIRPIVDHNRKVKHGDLYPFMEVL